VGERRGREEWAERADAGVMGDNSSMESLRGTESRKSSRRR
jgi:hypothetical protein